MAVQKKPLEYHMARPEDCTKGKVRVLVYGTLKRGHSNNHLLSESKFLGMGQVNLNGELVDLGAFPGVVRKPEAPMYAVRGEVYECDTDTLNALDWLEGHPRFYERIKHNTTTGIRTWVYTLPDTAGYDRLERCDGGYWHPTNHERAFWDDSASG